jgi:hypothetical protein
MTQKFETVKFPEFKTTKSGYEIRAEVLSMAKDFVVNDFAMKWQGWELTVARDTKTNQVVSTVGMPTYPGLDQVLSTAEKMYEFITANKK